ncbi:MAG: FAD-binding oxidoreductase [Gemmatimonadales bacterium]|nr:MAG: FAD-binding oxidoreductase [Gemmatimonadales bacterium]
MSEEHREGQRTDEPETATESEERATEGIGRRDFLRTTGLGAGGLAMAGSLGGILAACEAGRGPGILRRGPEIAVVGGGAFGVWTALALQEAGARVTLVDLYGPGNSRSTSGDETRGVRTSYAGRPVWTAWADRAIDRWLAFDEEFASEMGNPVYYTTGDLILRDTWDGMLENVAAEWDGAGVGYERLDGDEVRRRWPQIHAPDMEHALHEPKAGVVRARAACRRVAQIFEKRGGELRYARAEPGAAVGGELTDLRLDDGSALGADLFVFALGPWFPKAFPEIMAERIRITTMGHVYYWGTPPGDSRFSVPNLPSWNVPGVTGWPSLPPDHRGFRLRTGGRSADDPDTSVRWIPEQYHEQPLGILQQYFPDLAGQPLVETRACHYESSSTRDWIIDRHPEFSNVWFAGGGSAEGFKFGPVLGEFIAGRVLDRDPHPELTDRFRLDEVDEGSE